MKTAAIVQAANNLLNLTSELKTMIVVSDLTSVHQAKEMVENNLEQKKQGIRGTLDKIKDDITSDLWEIEEEAYQCRF